MFSRPKLLTSFSIILVILNVIALLVGILYISTIAIGFAIYIAIIAYLTTTTLVSIFLTVATRDITQQLNLEYDSNARNLSAMSKKITSLEQQLAAK